MIIHSLGIQSRCLLPIHDCIAKKEMTCGHFKRLHIFTHIKKYSADNFYVVMSTTPLSSWSFASLEWRFIRFYYLKKWIKGRSLVTALFKGGLSDEMLNHSYSPAANVLTSFEHNFASTRR